MPIYNGAYDANPIGFEITGTGRYVFTSNSTVRSTSGNAVEVNNGGVAGQANITFGGTALAIAGAVVLDGSDRFTLTNTGILAADDETIRALNGFNSIAVAGTVDSFLNTTGSTTQAVFMDGTFNALSVTGTINAGGIGVDSDGDFAQIQVSGAVLSEETAVSSAGTGSTVDVSGSVNSDRGFGVFVRGADSTVVVSGSVIGNTGIGVSSNDTDAWITNSGTVVGQFRGVDMGSDTILTNTGTITTLEGRSGSSSNLYAVGSRDFETGEQTVRNAGLIEGNVVLGAGDDTYDGRTGGAVIGTIDLGAGNDSFFGGAADEVAQLGAGDDNASDGFGVDVIFGQDGNDVFRAALDGAADTFVGGAGRDIVNYGDYTGDLVVDMADGTVETFGAGDTLVSIEGFIAGGGDDRLTATTGTAVLVGGGGDDRLVGTTGRQVLNGGSGDDLIVGDAGNDVLVGGAGRDVLIGGTGADTFVFSSGSDRDVVRDFEDGDRIDVRGTDIDDFVDVTDQAQQSGANVLVADGSDLLVLQNVQLADLDAGDFVF